MLVVGVASRAAVGNGFGIMVVWDLTPASISWCSALSLSRTSHLVLPKAFRRSRFPSGLVAQIDPLGRLAEVVITGGRVEPGQRGVGCAYQVGAVPKQPVDG